MIKQEQITQIIKPFLAETELFLVKLTVGKDNLINVYIDGDKGVTIDDCVRLSRHIEQSLDRETEDFELRVSSPGADEPFVNIRQYIKNTGMPISIKLTDGSEKRGVLEHADANYLMLKEQVKNKNKKSKNMITGESISIQMSDIAEAKVIIIF